MMLNPRKYLIKEMINKPTPFDVWLQGTIEQNVGNDILIISDTFGRAKITKCETADGVIDKGSLQKGHLEGVRGDIDPTSRGTYYYVYFISQDHGIPDFWKKYVGKKSKSQNGHSDTLHTQLSENALLPTYQVNESKRLLQSKYCCILGTAVSTKGLPEVQASKFVDLSLQPQMKEAWEHEVREANLLLDGKIKPCV